jgi:hypothetical protein
VICTQTSSPSAAVDKLLCYITVFSLYNRRVEPSKNLQKEVTIATAGAIEAHWDGRSRTVAPGSVLFSAAGATTLRCNAGTTPFTYVATYYPTSLAPKS